MATKLRELGDAEGAATVLVRHAGDVAEAVRALIDGNTSLAHSHLTRCMRVHIQENTITHVTHRTLLIIILLNVGTLN